MAVKGSGTVRETIDPPMKDQTSSNIARDGAAKKPQTKFPTKDGMRSRIGELYANEPGAKGTGPDASAPNPLDPTNPGKTFAKAPIKWGMKDPMGSSINDVGPQILDEGRLTGR